MPIVSIGSLPLQRGGVLADAKVAYEARGALDAQRSNAVLVPHGYTGGPAAILPGGDPLEGALSDLIGPGGYIDTDRFFVICPNAIGSTYGSTGAASVDPATGKPYGSHFPEVAMNDVVESQRRLLGELGIERLAAVVGPSFGGMQALQWAIDHPEAMRGVVAASCSLATPPVMTEKMRAGLSQDPNWNGGDYYAHGNLVDTLVPMRVGMLKSYGVEKAMEATVPDEKERNALMAARAREWAQGFDANALINLMGVMGTYDATGRLGRIRAKVLYVLSRTDAFFPPALAGPAMQAFAEAGVNAQYVEIDSENGHAAAGADPDAWGPQLKGFLESL